MLRSVMLELIELLQQLKIDMQSVTPFRRKFRGLSQVTSSLKPNARRLSIALLRQTSILDEEVVKTKILVQKLKKELELDVKREQRLDRIKDD